MESFLSRYRNSVVLVALVFVQVIALATQVKRVDPSNPQGDKVKVLRIWVMQAMTPVGKALNRTGENTRNFWHSYLSIRATSEKNQELQREVNELRAERSRLYQEAQRTMELERLFGFKEQYVTRTLAAQVIYSSGTDSSHILYIDKGKKDGLVPELPVITPDGIVGKVREVYDGSAQVLLLNDQQSGVGVMLANTRRQGIMKGSVSGQLEIHYIMSDEKVEPGEKVYTSGGDRIFPKGLEVGQVTKVMPDKERDGFQLIRVKPNANLFRLEEVLVVMHVEDKAPVLEQQQSPAEMLASRLPGIDKQQADEEAKLDAKSTTPPPVKPAKALAPDRFSPPEEKAAGLVKPKNTPKIERVTQPVNDTPKPKPDTATEAPQDPQEH